MKMDDYERNLLKNISKFGCSVTSVFDPEAEDPPFSYSIGISQTTGAPEIIIVGLDGNVAHSLINDYHRMVAAGRRFEPHTSYDEFLEGYDVRFGPVSREHRETYMRSACWLHKGPDFKAVQMLWPNKAGLWPWDEDAPESFREWQPILA